MAVSEPGSDPRKKRGSVRTTRCLYSGMRGRMSRRQPLRAVDTLTEIAPSHPNTSLSRLHFGRGKWHAINELSIPSRITPRKRRCVYDLLVGRAYGENWTEKSGALLKQSRVN